MSNTGLNPSTSRSARACDAAVVRDTGAGADGRAEGPNGCRQRVALARPLPSFALPLPMAAATSEVGSPFLKTASTRQQGPAARVRSRARQAPPLRPLMIAAPPIQWHAPQQARQAPLDILDPERGSVIGQIEPFPQPRRMYVATIGDGMGTAWRFAPPPPPVVASEKRRHAATHADADALDSGAWRFVMESGRQDQETRETALKRRRLDRPARVRQHG